MLQTRHTSHLTANGVLHRSTSGADWFLCSRFCHKTGRFIRHASKSVARAVSRSFHATKRRAAEAVAGCGIGAAIVSESRHFLIIQKYPPLYRAMLAGGCVGGAAVAV